MTLSIRKTVCAGLLAGFTALPFAALSDTASDEAAIREIWAQYAAARVAGDAEAWLDLWAEGAAHLPPGRPVRAIADLEPVLADAWAANPRDEMEITPTEIVVSDDWAWSSGTYRGATGDTVFEGKFMTIFVRQDDGSWRIFRDMFNSNG